MRQSLVTALVSCTDSSRKSYARQFLDGLSSDELQFIAEFLGSFILECSEGSACSRAQLAGRIAECIEKRLGRTEDVDHKIILLMEFVGRGGARFASAGQA